MPYWWLVPATTRKLVLDKSKLLKDDTRIRLIDDNGEVVDEELDDLELLERDIEADMDWFDPLKLDTMEKDLAGEDGMASETKTVPMTFWDWLHEHCEVTYKGERFAEQKWSRNWREVDIEAKKNSQNSSYTDPYDESVKPEVEYRLKNWVFQGDFPIIKDSLLMTQTVHLTLAQVLTMKHWLAVANEGEANAYLEWRKEITVGATQVPAGSILVDKLPSGRRCDEVGVFDKPVETFLKMHAPGTRVSVHVDALKAREKQASWQWKLYDSLPADEKGRFDRWWELKRRYTAQATLIAYDFETDSFSLMFAGNKTQREKKTEDGKGLVDGLYMPDWELNKKQVCVEGVKVADIKCYDELVDPDVDWESIEYLEGRVRELKRQFVTTDWEERVQEETQKLEWQRQETLDAEQQAISEASEGGLVEEAEMPLAPKPKIVLDPRHRIDESAGNVAEQLEKKVRAAVAAAKLKERERQELRAGGALIWRKWRDAVEEERTKLRENVWRQEWRLQLLKTRRTENAFHQAKRWASLWLFNQRGDKSVNSAVYRSLPVKFRTPDVNTVPVTFVLLYDDAWSFQPPPEDAVHPVTGEEILVEQEKQFYFPLLFRTENRHLWTSQYFGRMMALERRFESDWNVLRNDMEWALWVEKDELSDKLLEKVQADARVRAKALEKEYTDWCEVERLKVEDEYAAFVKETDWRNDERVQKVMNAEGEVDPEDARAASLWNMERVSEAQKLRKAKQEELDAKYYAWCEQRQKELHAVYEAQTESRKGELEQDVKVEMDKRREMLEMDVEDELQRKRAYIQSEGKSQVVRMVERTYNRDDGYSNEELLTRWHEFHKNRGHQAKYHKKFAKM